MEITLIGLFIIPSSVFLAFFNPRHLLCLLIFFSTFTATAVVNLNSFGLQAGTFIGMLFVAKVLSMIARQRFRLTLSRPHRSILIGFFIFFVIVIAGFIVAANRASISFVNLTQLIYLLTGISIAIATSIYLTLDPGALEPSFNAFFASAFFVGLWGLYQFVTIHTGIVYWDSLFNNSTSDAAQKFNMLLQGGEFSRISSVSVEPSFLARTSAFSLTMMIFYYYLNPYKKATKYLHITFALTVLMLVLTFSTTSIAAFFIVVLLVFLFKPLKTLPLILAVGISATIFLLANDEYLKVFNILTTEKTNTQSYRLRTETIFNAWQGFLSSPLIGNGWETFQAQDVIFKLLSNTGILGLLVFLYIYFKAIIGNISRSRRRQAPSRFIHLSTGLAVLTLLLLDIISSLSFVFTFMWILLGIAIFTSSYKIESVEYNN